MCFHPLNLTALDAPLQLCTFPVLQQFGLIFRDRFLSLGITTSQITTVINVHSAFTYGIGLANGPLFRRFTYRQVAFCGALLVVLAVFLTSISNSFLTYLVTFSILYGKSRESLCSACSKGAAPSPFVGTSSDPLFSSTAHPSHPQAPGPASPRPPMRSP